MSKSINECAMKELKQSIKRCEEMIDSTSTPEFLKKNYAKTLQVSIYLYNLCETVDNLRIK